MKSASLSVFPTCFSRCPALFDALHPTPLHRHGWALSNDVGGFKNGGREWQRQGAPERVNVHDFIGKELGKVTLYGVYDVAGNAGWVSVGTDHDTAAFAVATIRTWWDRAGQAAYPGARRLLITADGGGSNGYRTRLWKTGLAALAADTGLQIIVCHLPPGTSKWNEMEPGCSPTSR
jgi:Rhodopirellula transposase DDE domain